MLKEINGAQLKNMLISAANNLENNRQTVDDLNVFPVPDGDTGTNMSLTVKAVVKEISSMDEDNASIIADAAANASLRGARGNSGVILSQFFRGFAKGMKGNHIIDVKIAAVALQSAVDTAYRAVMKPAEGTILTVARESVAEGMAFSALTVDLIEFLEFLVEKAKKSLERTPELLPVLKQAGVVDAGGYGLVCILEGALFYLVNGVAVETKVEDSSEGQIIKNKVILPEEITFGYCTEFLIIKKDIRIKSKEFKKKLEYIGDSVLVIDDKDIIKVHVHTNNPGIAIEEAIKLGELTSLKIDNMREQAAEEIAEKEQSERVEFGFVSVVAGDGLKELFRELGCEEIIPGGQTMNPSTDDILHKIEEVNAKTIYVLPNNKNIILAAEQAKKIAEKNQIDKTVVVLPTKAIVQGISALIAFNPEASRAENTADMLEAVSNTKTGCVTFAARDSKLDNKKINKDDVIGMLEGKISIIGNGVDFVAEEIVSKIADDSTGVITFFYGNNLCEQDTTALFDTITAKYPNADVSFHNGGQPLYYYYISVE